MDSYFYPDRFSPIMVRDEARQRERHARNIGQIEGYGAAIRDMRGAQMRERMRPLLPEPKPEEKKSKSRKTTTSSPQKTQTTRESNTTGSKSKPTVSTSKTTQTGSKPKTTTSTSKTTQTAQDKYKQYKSTKGKSKETGSSEAPTTRDDFEKYQQYKKKHYEYRELLQQDGDLKSKKTHEKRSQSKKDSTRDSKKDTRGRWDSVEESEYRIQPKDSSDLRREKAERERERAVYYEQQLQKEQDRRYAAEQWQRQRLDVAERNYRGYGVVDVPRGKCT